MNPEWKPNFCDKPKNFESEEKLKKAQAYKKKNQKHPAFKK